MKKMLRKFLCLVLALTLALPNASLIQAAETSSVTEEELIAKTNPILKSYDVSDSGKVWTVTSDTRFVVEAAGDNMTNSRLTEVVKLINAEFVEKEIASATPHVMTYAAKAQTNSQDIFIRLVSVEEISSETTSDEAYKITIDDSGVVVEAASEDAAMYALRTIQTMMITNNGLVHGTIVDYPDVAERRLHVDCARKYISKDWFIRQIREMSYLKMNTIQIHFSENLGFRIECDTDPAIVSEQHLKKSEVREILAEAKKYGINVIPSFDSPGHVDQILKAHPEYGQVNSDGEHYASGLDITNPDAVEYIYSLYDEYMELFKGCTDFHIGGDEYMEFDRAPFTTEYKSVLNAYAQRELGEGYIWKDAIADYINDLAAHVYSKGFKPRIFNDGIYYGENSYEGAQKIKMHDYIGIDFWSQMSWNSSIAKLQTFIDKGHTNIYNFNASFFYYVLRGQKPTDGREAHSFDVLNQDANIYNNWTPGKFQENTISDDHESISGVSMGIWCDYADICTEDTIHTDIASALRSLASKSWNTQSNSILPYEDFVTLTEEIGNVAGYEKGSELPAVGDFLAADNLGTVIIKYQDTEGNTIKASDTMYGELDSQYSFTAPAINKWLATSEDAVTGTYKENPDEIIFIYELDPNPPKHASDMDTYPSVSEYQTTGDAFALNENSRFVVISNEQSLQNKVLENDLKLLSSEFTEVGLTDVSMNIVYGTESTVKPGDIVIRLDEASADSNHEAYEIKITNYAEVSSTGEAGIFYGVRTIQKTMLLNDGQMDDGLIKDEPSVEVRGFHIDNARKMFTKDWIMALIKDLSYQNINTIQFHFSENEGYRLESSTLEALNGWQYPSDGYYTKEDMLDIIAECQKYHIELVPSLDSPGHMTYVLNYLPDDWDCTSLWPSDFRSEQTFNIFEKEECKEFLETLFTEYAEFFSEAGCKHMNIGGDEFLNNFGSMTNDQYITVIDYFNDIAALVKSYGLTPRAWNDGLLYQGYSGYKLDPDIEICYWSGPAQTGTIADFVANGNKVINMSDVYMYYVLASWWMSNANPIASKIFNEWTPGKLAGSNTAGDQSVQQPYPDYLLGASFALWCDTPNYMSQENVTTNIFMRTRAMAERSWNPNTAYTYSKLESICNKLGNAPGYDGNELPAPGDVLYEGEFGTLVLKYVDTNGRTLRNDKVVYGLIDDSYTIEPEALYGYRFVSMDKPAEGIYTDAEVEVTLTYELYIDVKNEDDYIPATYADYKEALKNAQAVIANADSSQEDIDAALAELAEAETKLVLLDRLALYLEVTYPVASAGYTSGSYAAYQNAVNTGKRVLYNSDASAGDVANALEDILEAKAALAPASGITVTANKTVYQNYVLNNMLDGNTSTKTWINGNQAIGDYFLFTFASPVILESFRLQSPANAGSDYLHSAVVEISLDGNTWTEIGTITEELDRTLDANGATVQFVRVRITKTVENWAQISEVTFDYTEAPVDKSNLTEAIEAAGKLTEDDYSKSSWAVLEAALANAIAVNEDDSATAGEINAAVLALNTAIDSLAAPTPTPTPDVKPTPTPGAKPTPTPGAKPTVTPAPDVKPALTFEDVKKTDFHYDAVLWALENNVTTGYDAKTFGTWDNCTRGQIVTFLWRAAGSPKVKNAACTFTDVPKDAYYYDAVLWAVSEGITTGYNAATFGSDDNCTRGQIVTFLWRAKGEKTPNSTKCDFTDISSTDYYYNAVLWAVENKITTGINATTFAPNNICNRAEAVTFLWRAYK